MLKTEYVFPPEFSLESIINAFHNPKQRVKWDSNLESYKTVKKVGRVALVHEEFASSKFENVQRDCFQKKFGFTFRPRNVQDSNQSMVFNYSSVVPNANASFSSRFSAKDSLEYFFFCSSVDNKDLVAAECPVAKGVTRIHAHLVLHKFEKVKRIK